MNRLIGLKKLLMKEHLNYYEYSQFTTIQEIRSGVKIQRKVDFHDNVISCHGITKLESGHSGNILVHQNTIKLADFGLSKRIEAWSIIQFSIQIIWDGSLCEHYDIGLIYNISQGRREIVVPDTPDEYVKTFILLKCWDGEPDNRPTIYRVVDFLKAIITKTDIIMENPQLLNEQELNEIPLSTNNLESRGELSQLIQNFDKMNTKEIDI
ncbi:uncharacterized protein OCT59_019892 [Rhizophagus irregularis]|uniref:uncharacterized protein n=1 Tax=Rhizophagus irregularis TaxID=588596 RepID=UPI00331B2593|nr:hypothetical protein OCT59_019892 [Rhizophagus irregularis]